MIRICDCGHRCKFHGFRTCWDFVTGDSFGKALSRVSFTKEQIEDYKVPQMCKPDFPDYL